MNVCFQCGAYRADKVVDPTGPYAICPECGYKHTFRQLPLLVVSGAICAGKSTVCQTLLGKIDSVVLLDSDIIWRAEFNTPATHYREFFETWLRVCKNIAQSGRPVVLFGAGCGVPDNLETRVERRYFSRIHYLALTCSEEVLRQRLGQRPAWRGANDTGFMDAQFRFNKWFKDYNGQPPINLLDTTNQPPDEVAHQVAAWINGIVSAS
jgi:hypothetical protein